VRDEGEVGDAVRRGLQREREREFLDSPVEKVRVVGTHEERQQVWRRGDDHGEIEMPGSLGGHGLER